MSSLVSPPTKRKALGCLTLGSGWDDLGQKIKDALDGALMELETKLESSLEDIVERLEVIEEKVENLERTKLGYD